jgi:hypothetical protein
VQLPPLLPRELLLILVVLGVFVGLALNHHRDVRGSEMRSASLGARLAPRLLRLDGEVADAERRTQRGNGALRGLHLLLDGRERVRPRMNDHA